MPYEESVQRLLPWVPDTLAHLNGLGPCPTEPEAVEQRKNEIEVRGLNSHLMYMYIRVRAHFVNKVNSEGNNLYLLMWYELFRANVIVHLKCNH